MVRLVGVSMSMTIIGAPAKPTGPSRIPTPYFEVQMLVANPSIANPVALNRPTLWTGLLLGRSTIFTNNVIGKIQH